MKLLMMASAGGAIGAGLRFLVNESFAMRGLAAPFPWHTFAINVAGSFAMGVVFVLIHEKLGASPEWRTFLATGILGGFTTFSAFSLDVMNLMSGGEGAAARAGAYIIGSVGLSIAALLAGVWITRAGLST